jgi:integrase
MRTKVPGYRRHPSGQGFVTLNGKCFYFGKYENPQSKLAYDEKIREWLANGRSLTKAETNEASDITVNRLLELFLVHSEKIYVKGGKPTSQLGNVKLAVRAARLTYGETLARDFSAVALRRIRDGIIAENRLCRREVNRRTKLIAQIFRWGVSEGLVPPSVAHSVREFVHLRRGRTDIPDHDPVLAVPWDVVEATLPFVSRQVRAMILLQWETGMRPGEVCAMRACDIDSDWYYRPARHKTQHHGKERPIYLRPSVTKAILEPWLQDRPADAYLFSAAEAMLEARPPSKSRHRRIKRHPKTQPGSRYTTGSYYQHVQIACRKAGIEPWNPHRLRHSFMTRCEAQCGAEVARTQAGHSEVAISERYIHRDIAVARKALDEMV